MKKILVLLFLFLGVVFLSSCKANNTKEDSIDSTKELFIGESVNLLVNGNYEVKIINDDVITYKFNKVTGKKAGIAYIELYLNEKLKERIEYIVKSDKYSNRVGELGLSFYNDFMHLEVGEIKEIQGTRIVKLTSLTPNIAQIIDGRFLYGVSVGMASIKINEDIYYINVKAPTEYSSIEDSVIRVSEKARSETVTVLNYQKGKNHEYALYAMGSGVVYKIGDEDIFILTNRHVIKDSEALFVNFSKANEKVYARLVAYDDMVDLAVLAVNRKNVNNILDISACKFGYSDDVKVGQFVLTVGSPLDLELSGTVCLGIVSKKEVYLEEDIDEDGKYEYFNKYMQVDASINSGNSGGPLYNLKGMVVGINTAGVDHSLADNLGFSIPTDIIMCVLDRLENASKLEYKELGISCYSINHIIDYDFDKEIGDATYGVLVTGVMKGSLAESAGVLEDDIIQKYNGVDVLSAKALLVSFFNTNIKEEKLVELVILRDGESINITIDLDKEE